MLGNYLNFILHYTTTDKSFSIQKPHMFDQSNTVRRKFGEAFTIIFVNWSESYKIKLPCDRQYSFMVVYVSV